MNTSRESEHKAMHNALLSDYCPAPIAEARRRQDEIMIARFRGRPLSIADLGCGDGYHASLLGPGYLRYDAFELAPQIAQLARERFAREGLQHVTLFETDVATVTVGQAIYDLVVCLYFTPGNFRDVSEDMSVYTDDYLDHNPVFTRIVASFHRALRTGGHMLLCVYKDVPEAAAAQRDFYLQTGQHVVTPASARFVATAEGFWSARWTRDSMLSNLHDAGIGTGAVTFGDLNSIAWLVQIEKA